MYALALQEIISALDAPIGVLSGDNGIEKSVDATKNED